MAAKTLSEFFIEWRSSCNPVTGEQRLYKDITEQMIWDAAIKSLEGVQNQTNNSRYVTALEVISDYQRERYTDICDYSALRRFCAERLNPPKAADCT